MNTPTPPNEDRVHLDDGLGIFCLDSAELWPGLRMKKVVFFTCAAESNVCTSPRLWEIDFSEKLEHKHDVHALPQALLRHDI